MRFLQGVSDNLPKRPILITFDDGRLDSYRGADKILAEAGMRATMFAIAGYMEEDSPFYLDWGELRRMMKSGRWDVQEHAGIGHANVRYDAAGHKGPAYAYRQYTPGEGLESFAEFKSRVRHDILWAKRTMTEQLPGFSPLELRGAVRQLRARRRHQRQAHRALHAELPGAPLPRRVHDAPAGLHDAEEHALAAGPDRGPLGHEHRRPLPLAARPHAGAAHAARAADRDAGRRSAPAAQVQHAADRLELVGERQAGLGSGLEGARGDGARLALVQARTRRFSRATIES